MTQCGLLFVYLLCLPGLRHARCDKAPVAPDALESARSWAATITQAFPAMRRSRSRDMSSPNCLQSAATS